MKTRHGFTLVEILIVVVILGILAAIVIPQFTQASSEAKVSSLISNLQTVRSQIQLYKIQHNDTLPGSTTGVDFTTALLSKTDQDGTVNATTGKYGPYLQQMPANPFIDTDATARTVTSGTNTTLTGDNSAGWYFNTDTGQFNAYNSGTLTDGTNRAYTSL
jgi:general secretion pathway protein G